VFKSDVMGGVMMVILGYGVVEEETTMRAESGSLEERPGGDNSSVL
jgi:hypothetical protein